jgi:hypothetical protein
MTLSLSKVRYVGAEVFTVVVMKISVFRDLTTCSLMRVSRRFGWTYRHHLQIPSKCKLSKKPVWARHRLFEDGNINSFRNVAMRKVQHILTNNRSPTSWPLICDLHYFLVSLLQIFQVLVITFGTLCCNYITQSPFLFSLALQPPLAVASAFSFMVILQTVGLLGRVISSSQGLYLNTGQHKHRINTYTHQTSMPCVGFEPTIPASERAKTVHAFFFFSGVGLTSPGTAATSGLLYSPRW